jgi:WD40 repeat protein
MGRGVCFIFFLFFFCRSGIDFFCLWYSLATGAEDRVIRVWDITNGDLKHVLVGHEQDIYSLDWSADAKILVSGSGDKSVKVWDMESGKCLMTLVGDGVTVAGDEQTAVAGGAGGGVAPDGGITSIALSSVDSRTLVTVIKPTLFLHSSPFSLKHFSSVLS